MPRVEYDRIADGYDRRYGVHSFAGVERALLEFVGGPGRMVLEVGCGTGHWLNVLSRRAQGLLVFGIDPSWQMLVRARSSAPAARIIRAAAEHLPLASHVLDRVFCINAAHHFADRAQAFAQAARVLRAGGGLFVAGREPPPDTERWWVYDYFEGTRELDRSRYPTAATLHAEMRAAGFGGCETMEVDRITASIPADEALTTGVVDRRFTSQLSVLSDTDFARGVERIRSARAKAARHGETLMLRADIAYEATVGWM